METSQCGRKNWLLVFARMVTITWSLFIAASFAESPRFMPVVPDYNLVFPEDYGAHPGFRIEWWYVTGWLETTEKKPMGFQVTFFRYATDHNPENPSRFAPKHLIIAHLALSDPAIGKLLHEEKTARESFDLAYSRPGNTDVKLDEWTFIRDAEKGRYQLDMPGKNLGLALLLTPTQPMLLQGEEGYSRKGPGLDQASYYYSEPHLQVTGTVFRQGKPVTVTGSAWLDHEWSSDILAPRAVGWDWVGANLDDGSALMAAQIRLKDGGKLWAYAALRDAAGHITVFKSEQVEFTPQRTWRSPHTDAIYPVEMHIRTGETEWLLTPLFDDQELDTRNSAGEVYWEGAVTLKRDGQPAGRGYLELTGYVRPLDM